jgi:hypothetical protein
MIVLAVVLGATAGGTLATYLYDGRASMTTRLSAGICLGLTGLGLLGFIAASLFGFSIPVLMACVLVVSAPAGLLFTRQYRIRAAADVRAAIERVRTAVSGRDPLALCGFALFLLLCVPLSVVFSRALYETADGVYTGISVNQNDVPLHIDIIEGFLTGGNFPPQHPEFAGARLTYPFLVDFIAAQFAQAGLTLPQAVTLENLLLITALVVLLHRWALALTGDRTAALVTPLIILLGSGLGWLLIPGDLRAAHTGVLSFLWHLPHDYTINTRNLRWGNLTTTMLVSQRSFLLGLPLSLMVWTLWWRAVGEVRQSRAGQMRLMSAAGILAGCMPLVHAHSFIVLMGMAGLLSLLFRAWRPWFAFFVLAAAVALPQLLWLSDGSLVHSRSFVGWHPGWTKETEGYAWFWFKNTGVFIPLLVAAIAAHRRWSGVPRALILFSAPFLACFIVPQLVRLAPRPSANIKVLVYWYIASAPLVSLVIARLWRGGIALRAVALGAIISLTGAASLDVWRVITGASTVKVFDADSVAFARVVGRQTPPDAVILHAPSRHHSIFLTGRHSLLGNPLHVGSHGFDYTRRESDIRSIYAGAADLDALLQRHRVDYIVVGPEEREKLSARDGVFARFPVVADLGEYRLYLATTFATATERHRPASAAPATMTPPGVDRALADVRRNASATRDP